MNAGLGTRVLKHLLLAANGTTGPPGSAHCLSSAASDPNESLGFRQGMAREAAEVPQPAMANSAFTRDFLGRESALNLGPHR